MGRYLLILFFLVFLIDITAAEAEYLPRRGDWNDAVEGMPLEYRQLEFTDLLKEIAGGKIAVDYWVKKPVCEFPEVNLPVEQQRRWMLRPDGTPKRPFGEVFYAKPGAYLFQNSCAKCHGQAANGRSDLAKGILEWSGGQVRVADLASGMFGHANENLKTFETEGKDLSGNYFIWMAMGGSLVRFPAELTAIVGKHPRMLNWVREKCFSQIDGERRSKPAYVDHEIFQKVCFADNLEAGHPDLEFNLETGKPVHPEKVEAWLDRAATNGGWLIFDYLKKVATEGWAIRSGQCEMAYPKP